MSPFKRYSSSFFITFTIYLLLFIAIFFSYDNLIVPVSKVKDKEISLNHISLVSEKKVVKNDIKKPVDNPIKKPIKKISKKIIKKPIKKPVKKLVKKVVKKKVIEKPINKVVKKELIKSIDNKTSKKKEDIKKVLKTTYEEDFLKENLNLIVKLIQKNVKYPKRARRLNIQGSVLLEFKISTNGDIENIKAINGNKFLIKSSIKAIKKASKSFPKVKKEIVLKVPINYTLT